MTERQNSLIKELDPLFDELFDELCKVDKEEQLNEVNNLKFKIEDLENQIINFELDNLAKS